MGFFSKLFGTSSQSTPKTSPSAKTQAEPEELQPAIAALQADEFEQALQLATPHALHADLTIRLDANRLCALALSRLERYADALTHWKVLVELEPEPHNFLQLASSAAVAGDLEMAEPAFHEAVHRAHAAETDGPSSMPGMHANYATALARGGRADLALRHVDVLRDWYMDLHITDSTFLYLRGMPFFSGFLQQGIPIAKLVKSQPELDAWLDEMHDKLDEEGQTALSDYRAQTS